jgi:hypothetical protein
VIFELNVVDLLRIYLICLAFIGVDKPQLPGIGDQYLVTTLLEHPACPRRVSSRLHCDALRLLGGEASQKALGVVCSLPIISPLTVSMRQRWELFVAEIHSGCHMWLHFATIHGGPILPPLWAHRARRILAYQRVLRMVVRPSHLRRIYVLRGWVNRGSWQGWTQGPPVRCRLGSLLLAFNVNPAHLPPPASFSPRHPRTSRTSLTTSTIQTFISLPTAFSTLR